VKKLDSMFAALKRHPLAIEAFFDYSLVLTFALPAERLAPMLPPGLHLDAHAGCGFVAIALVQTSALRPKGLPACLGQDFFLSGYRIFACHQTARGQTLRGLFILRSDADRRSIVSAGNALTHYRYQLARVQCERNARVLSLQITTPKAQADLSVRAELDTTPTELPAGSPFEDWHTARHFAGPLPYTFDYDAQAHGIVLVKGVRKQWAPRSVRVAIDRCTFFDAPRFGGVRAQLASAFYLQNVPYHWRRGVLSPLPHTA
jgi:uncharacterized protein YqjF (DUF2071 family)